MTKPQAVGTLAGAVFGRITVYLLLRRLGAPRWFAYGVTLVLGGLEASREHSGGRKAWAVLFEREPGDG